MRILGERYDERYGFDCDNYDLYDPFDIVTYCDTCECSDCPKYGDDCDGNIEEEDDMWIDANDCTPLADGNYKVETRNNNSVMMPYTREGGWNTFYTESGKLVGEDISEYVLRWFNPAIKGE